MSEESKKKHLKEEKPLEKMTVKDLREIALEIPHEHTEVAVRDMNKEQLVSFIKQARGIKDEGPAHLEKKKKAKVKVALTKQDIKAKIRQLKEEKAAVGKDERKSAALLRRRISRLKKKSRKIA
ncbi:MAG TPA: transcription termination factor Rho [Deltaproteobacteria bacterium]|nr:transcription termination factor Rho [Deltaproteobacteria bacterium]HPR55339.1 transcription termination factor Rho [Deltaproteobacteria bacterium]HXK47465.1 transcription termination factor Rho [Deltaproteobacteria bacterium]